MNDKLINALDNLQSLGDWVQVAATFSYELEDLSDVAALNAKLEIISGKSSLNPDDVFTVRLKLVTLLHQLISKESHFSDSDLDYFTYLFSAAGASDAIGRQLKISLLLKLLDRIDVETQKLDWALVNGQVAIDILNSTPSHIQDVEAALQRLLKSRSVFIELGEDQYRADMEVKIAQFYINAAMQHQQDTFDTAIEYLNSALGLFQIDESPEEYVEAMIQLGQAQIYRSANSPADSLKEAIGTLKSALDLCWRRSQSRNRVTCSTFLGEAYRKLGDIESQENKKLAIVYYMQALDSDRSLFPDDRWWLNCHMNLAGTLASLHGTHRTKNIQRAIEYYEIAANEMEAVGDILGWAECIGSKVGLAMELDSSIELAKLESTIRQCENVLERIAGLGESQRWAEFHNMLGCLYSERMKDDPSTNLKKAEEHFQIAINYYSDNGNLLRANIIQQNMMLGRQSLDRVPNESFRVQDVAISRESLVVALRHGSAEEVADAQVRLAGALARHVSGRPETLQQSINLYEKALLYYIRDDFPLDWAGIHFNMGLAFLEQNGSVNALEDQRASLEHLKKSLIIYNQKEHPIHWARANDAISSLYVHRLEGDPTQNIELAIEHAELAAKVFRRDLHPNDWANNQLSLGNAKLYRPNKPAPVNAAEAIGHFRNAGEVYRRHTNPAQYALIQFNLGTAYSQSDMNINDRLAAIQAFEACIETIDKASFSQLWAAAHVNLSNIERRQNDSARNAKDSIYHLTMASEVYTKEIDPFGWASVQFNLGNSYYTLFEGDSRKESLDTAIQYLLEATNYFVNQNVIEWIIKCYGNLVRFYFFGGDMQAVVDYGEKLLAIVDKEIAVSVSDSSRLQHFSNLTEVYEMIATCYLWKNEVQKAVNVLDEGRARVLAENVSPLPIDISRLSSLEKENLDVHLGKIRLREANLRQLVADDSEDRKIAVSTLLAHDREELKTYLNTLTSKYPDITLPKFDVGEIFEILPNDGAIWIPIITSRGSQHVILLPGGFQNTVIIENINCTRQEIRNLVFGSNENLGWITAYLRTRGSNSAKMRDELKQHLDKLLSNTWKLLAEPVFKKLVDLEVKRLFIVPQGIMGLIPLQASWRIHDERRQYLIDFFEISYAPNVEILASRLFRERENNNHESSLFILANPTGDLNNAEKEGALVSRMFRNVTTLDAEESLTADTVISLLPKHQYVHFACHGLYNVIDPWHSLLLFAENEGLTTNDIASKLNLVGTRLVVLSACETGMADFRQVPSEYISLPGGFLQAGANGIVSSLWMVDDAATSILMERFYHHHINERLRPSAALREAQIWLRNSSVNQLTRLDYSNTRGMVDEEFQQLFDRIMGEVQRYSHPYFWGAFIMTGV